MQVADLLALPDLQGLPVIVDPVGQPFVPDLQTWSTDAERRSHRRHRHEAVAHSGMSLEELHLFFARAGITAAKSWNADQNIWGKVKNVLTTAHVGFAQVPGRILKQAMDAMGDETCEAVIPTATYLLRADAALEFRDSLGALRGQAA